ncbi:MAG TPA: VOC family protein [Terriglobales bacterium]|nr:VOC family protein [Terriglobales bacterium]
MSAGFRFVYTGIRVREMEESVRFYTEVLGMVIVEPIQKTAPTKGSVATLKSPNSEQLLELNHYEEDSPYSSPYVNGEDLDHIAFDVENLEAAIKELKRQGIEVVVEPGQIGREIGWKEAYVKDPNGIWIELLQRK